MNGSCAYLEHAFCQIEDSKAVVTITFLYKDRLGTIRWHLVSAMVLIVSYTFLNLFPVWIKKTLLQAVSIVE